MPKSRMEQSQERAEQLDIFPLHRVALARLGIYAQELIPSSIETFLLVYQNQEIAQMYFRIMSDYQMRMYEEIDAEMTKIRDEGTQPVEQKLILDSQYFTASNDANTVQGSLWNFLNVLRREYRLATKQITMTPFITINKSNAEKAAEQQKVQINSGPVKKRYTNIQKNLLEEQLKRKADEAEKRRKQYLDTVSMQARKKFARVVEMNVELQKQVEAIADIFYAPQKITYQNAVTMRRFKASQQSDTQKTIQAKRVVDAMLTKQKILSYETFQQRSGVIYHKEQLTESRLTELREKEREKRIQSFQQKQERLSETQRHYKQLQLEHDQYIQELIDNKHSQRRYVDEYYRKKITSRLGQHNSMSRSPQSGYKSGLDARSHSTNKSLIARAKLQRLSESQSQMEHLVGIVLRESEKIAKHIENPTDLARFDHLSIVVQEKVSSLSPHKGARWKKVD